MRMPTAVWAAGGEPEGGNGDFVTEGEDLHRAGRPCGLSYTLILP